ncbi:MAG: NADH-quinone oxidoreductase subunit L [Candidatus Tokpelaia sp. JSC161]|jgi:NADH-quinone oxidoreductase subunit L|nr:MAG: NADH-quinone oxidoreductase subunit L [Candidatus Tokpelaia sp. JSC161]
MLFYSLIIFLPFVGCLCSFLGTKRIGIFWSELVTCTLMVFVALCSWIAFIHMAFSEVNLLHFPLLHWVSVKNLNFDWEFRIDTLTLVMLVVVNSVSALVHIYSVGYMHHDPDRPRFFSYLSLFTFMMQLLVTSDNCLQMFVGWEGVGLVSYLLIGFWYQRSSANIAAMKAFLVNRISDFCFLIGIFCIFSLFGTFSFDVIFARALSGEFIGNLYFLNQEVIPRDALTIVCLLLFIGAMGKSAQFLFHTWLPDAMEGPTPVSALIHAATMVTAGVFMVARMSPLFALSPTALRTITFIGAITAFFAASVGLVQNDIKRVIAYSTCSQLGYMFAALGVGAYSAAVFHLLTHAFFKALLFLSAGSVIHSVSGEQDIRKMGGLRKYIPTTYCMMLIGTCALTGVGFPETLFGTAGFFSKDFIIEVVFARTHSFAFWLLVISAFLTSFYSWRLIFMTFHGKPRATFHVRESPLVMLIPLGILACGALFSGRIFHSYFLGENYKQFWKGALYNSGENLLEHVPLWVTWVPFFVMIAGFVLAFLFYISFPAIPKFLTYFFPAVYRFLLNSWYFDKLYKLVFVQPTFVLSSFLWKICDVKIIDGFGPNALAGRVLDITKRMTRMQTGYLYHYAFTMLIGIVFFMSWMMIRSFT